MTPSPEQRFTDDKLADYKILAEKSSYPAISMSKQDLKALLARLEASERKNKAADAYDDFDCTHDAEHQCKCGTIQMKLLKEFREADEAWRQAAGK